MIAEESLARPFVLPQLRLDRLETSLNEPRYMVTLVGQGRRLIIAPKLADLIEQLQQGKSLEEAASALSLLWNQEVSAESLRVIIERQMFTQGLAYPEGHKLPQTMTAAEAQKVTQQPLTERLLTGQFAWRLLKGRHVGKICGPLTALYSPLSVLLALAFILSTRWLLYSTIDRSFLYQLVMQFNPAEYLVNLCLLIVVIMIHEFGHASAQMRFGLPAGGIGFQLYHYIPAFFTNVSASWRLKPRQRVVVDLGGIYFQSLASSILYLLYLETHYLPFMLAVLVSDVLCLVSINPFLRFDGYWLLTDALAVPNLQKISTRVLGHCWGKLIGRETQALPPQLSRWRAIIVGVYAILKNCFWAYLVFFIIKRARMVYGTAATTIEKFLAESLTGLRTGDVLLLTASVFRLVLFVLLLLTVSLLVLNMARKLYSLARSGLLKLRARQEVGAAGGEVA
ncbi:MAG: putative peptide zinc metalloprotease protein [Blastocatellia bacterium]|jgi:putative peptide zinc metalloprotease protein|nr:putative peptide zinc metalloprotease protein [Blastocatellia bacterium]